jgi:hypothetical protein
VTPPRPLACRPQDGAGVKSLAEAYKRDKTAHSTVRPGRAIVYAPRIGSWNGSDRVSTLTVIGRRVFIFKHMPEAGRTKPAPVWASQAGAGHFMT